MCFILILTGHSRRGYHDGRDQDVDVGLRQKGTSQNPPLRPSRSRHGQFHRPEPPQSCHQRPSHRFHRGDNGGEGRCPGSVTHNSILILLTPTAL